MPLQAWQISVVVLEQATLAAFCSYVLAASHTSFGGDRATVLSHRTFQMVLMIVSNVVWAVMVWTIPKRQVLFIALLSSAAQCLFACDTLWKCPRWYFFVLKAVGALVSVTLGSHMRKLGARLVGKSKIQQLTQVQKVLLFTFATNAVFMMAFPHFIFLHALETLVWALFCLSTWWDFATFILASNEAFGPALNQLGLKNIVGASGEQSGIHSQRQAELVRSARNKIQRGKKNLRTMIVINFVLLHMAYLLYVMVMPFWPINAVKAADNCHPRSHDDVRHLVETVRFYIEDVFHVIIVTSLCANIVFYKYMKNGGRLSQKQKTEGGSHAVAPHVGASNVNENTMVEMIQGALMAPDGVESIIARKVKNLKQLKILTPAVMQWMKESLKLAHDSKEIKGRLEQLLGNEFFVLNLQHLGVWDDLVQYCSAEALRMGTPMQAYFEELNLGKALGEAYPNVYGKIKHSDEADDSRIVRHSSILGGMSLYKKVKIGFTGNRQGVKDGGRRLVVSSCGPEACTRRQDGVLPLPFPRDDSKSQLCDEKCFIHCLRMIAIGIDDLYHTEVAKVVQRCKGEFKKTAIKGFGRMRSKCTSKNDHYNERYPRPSLNIDINRNASTFEQPKDLLSFIKAMKRHSSFAGRPVRSKNMFLFDLERAEQQFYYRTVMINWLYAPGITFKELAVSAKAKWDDYYNFAHAPGFGSKDPSESWSAWRAQIRTARAYLANPDMGDSLVYFIVETQLLLRPYLEGRMKMHFLYKIWRADGPQALYTDFKIEANHDVRSFEAVQNDAAKDMKQFLADTDDVNQQLPEKNGATRLWLAAEQGHLEAVREILRHPKVDPNKVRLSSKTSPLFIASHLGHDDVVQAIVSHADVQVNLGAVDSGATPLFMAVQGGREGVVDILLDQKHIDVNHGTQDGISPLCKAAQLGHEHITQSLLGAQGIDVTRAAKDGTTAMSTAAKAQHVKIILMLKAHLEMANFRPSADLPFPARHQFVSDAQFCRAVLGFCKDASSTNSIVETQLLPLHDTIM